MASPPGYDVTAAYMVSSQILYEMNQSVMFELVLLKSYEDKGHVISMHSMDERTGVITL